MDWQFESFTLVTGVFWGAAMRSGQIVNEMKKARARLLVEMGQIEKDKRYGWEEKLDTLQAEVTQNYCPACSLGDICH